MKNGKGIKEKRVKYADGEVVFEKDSEGKEVYFILSGKAEVSELIRGKKNTVAILNEGAFFGEMAALNDEPRSMTVAALGELHLYELSLDEMFGYMQSNTEILRDVFTSLARRLRNTNLKVSEMIYDSSVSRMQEIDQMLEDSYVDKPNILVVDDHPNVLEALKKLLSDDYNVFTAPDGESALLILRRYDIALVLSDYRMSGMSGVELLENVKQMCPDTIRIIISGHIDQSVLMKAIREVQVHEVLPKPWREEEVKFTVARWTEQHRRSRRLRERAEKYTIVQKQLEDAKELIQQLTQEMRQMVPSGRHQESWHRNLFGRKRMERTQV